MAASQITTLEQLAKKAGLSRSAVSRALRNDPNQSAKTQARVQALAQTFGYRPDPRVASLMTQIRQGRVRKHGETIALINTWHEPSGYRNMETLPPWLEGCRSRAGDFGYRLEEFCLYAPRMTPGRLDQILRARGIVGLVVLPFEEPDADLPINLEGFACATMGYSMRSPNIHRAARDFAHDITIAGRAVRQLGYRRPGLVLPDTVEYRNAHHWTAGFLTVQHELAANDRLPILLTPGEINSGTLFKANERAFRSWWRRHRPDVIFSYHDFVPTCLASLGATTKTAYVDLVLRGPGGGRAGMHLSWQKIGEATVELVIDQINRHESGIPVMAKRTLLHGDWAQGDLSMRRIPEPEI